MARVTFYLERRKDKRTGLIRTENIPINMQVSYDGKSFRFFTGERIDSSNWDSEKQEVKRGVAGRFEINNLLQSLSERAMKAYREAIISQTVVDNNYLRSRLKRKREEKAQAFFEKWDEYIISRRNEVSKPYIKGTMTAVNHFKIFCKKYSFKPTFENISLSILEKFRDYLVEYCNCAQNSVASVIQKLKTFLNYGRKAGYHNSVSYNQFRMSITEGQVYFLTWDELMRLLRFPLTSISLQQVRDAFCFACFTGLRYSDLKNLKQTDVKSDFIRFKTLKTKEDNSVPLNDFAKEILNRYKDYPIKTALLVLCNQKMNKHLKLIGQMAEFVEPVSVIKFIGSKRHEKSVPKWEVLTTHIARKTFITNALRLGMPSEVIMSITGHRTHKAFRRYYKILDEHKLNEMRKYFNIQLNEG